MVRPGGFELPTFWFVANGVKMSNALFGVAYGLETPFFPQLAAPNLAPKTDSYRTRTVGARTDEGSVNHAIALILRGWPQFVPSGEREMEKQVRGHHQR
jgi:hypothetical protein